MGHIVIYYDEKDPNEKNLPEILDELSGKDKRSRSSLVRNLLWAAIEALSYRNGILNAPGRGTPKDNPLRAFIGPVTYK